MANANSIISQPALAVTENPIERTEDVWFIRYQGKKEDLLKTGVITEDMFPVAPKRVKHFAMDAQGRVISREYANWLMDRIFAKYPEDMEAAWRDPDYPRSGVARRGKGGRFSVRLGRSKSDQEYEETRQLRASSPSSFADKTKATLMKALALMCPLIKGESVFNAQNNKYKLSNEAEILKIIEQLMAAVEKGTGVDAKVERAFRVIHGGAL